MRDDPRAAARSHESAAAKPYYELERLWREEYWTPDQRDRAGRTLEGLPADAESALDVGCGAGVVTVDLRRRVSRVVGTDFARTPLIQVRDAGVPAVQSSVTHLPFRDGSFDLVLASEVIEHLPEAERTQALREIARVAGRYVLLTVPYREVLEWGFARCADCDRVFHVNRHTRSFDEAAMGSLFGGAFEAIRRWTFGDRTKRMPRTFIRLGHRFRGYMAVPPGRAMCPECGNTQRFVTERNMMTHVFLGIPDRVLPLRKRPRYIAALYRRASR